MAGRPIQKRADIAALKKLNNNPDKLIDLKPTIVYIMRNAGCTYSEIGKVFGITRQMAETAYKNIEEDLNK